MINYRLNFIGDDKMKYTRYDYKKKKKENLAPIIFIVAILLVSLLLGTALSNMFIKNKGDKSSNKANSINVSKPSEEKGNLKLYAIQCGYFGKVENAEEIKNKMVSAGYEAFAIKDNDKVRVIAGIFGDKDSEVLSKELKDKGFDNTRIGFEISREDVTDYEIGEIIEANLKILTKFKEKDVKSIQTAELKKWMASIKEGDKKGKHDALLQEVKKYTEDLPEEIKKENLKDSYTAIYGFLVRLKE